MTNFRTLLYGRLAVLVPSPLVFGLASIATSFVSSFEAGIATRILTGAASGGMLGIAMAMADDLGEKAAPKAIAFVTSGLTLDIILSPGIGALSAQMWSWRFAFAVLGGLVLIVALISLPSLRATAAPRNRPNTDAGHVAGPLFVPGAWGSLIAMALGLGGAVGCFAVWAVSGGMGAPGLQTHIAQLSPARRGALMALAGSCMNLGIAGASALAASVFPAGAAWVAVVALVLITIAGVALRPVRVGKAELASAG
ncbi:MAG: MFS transporter [Tropicimonas sp.]|uniref:MFS transporter n=1 Tax=Tropicimonas sp. TaxID=2067044 RepID=UPI003A848267